MEESFLPADGEDPEYFPVTSFLYNIEDCEQNTALANAKGQEVCAQVVQRVSEGVKFKESPISELSPSIYDPISGIEITTSTQYMGEGRFQVAYTSTLAGLYDVGISMKKIRSTAS